MRRRFSSTFLTWLMLVLGFPGLAAAASLTVHVTDQSSNALPDAIVYAVPVNGRAPVRRPSMVAIEQINKQFSPAITVIQVGTPVNFPNRDSVRHHVYSFSLAKTFELKLYAGVPEQPVLFDKPGLVTLGCNIHDKMLAYILVVETPWFAKANVSGAARIEGAPTETYDVHVWHPRLTRSGGPVVRGVKIEADGVLDITAELKPKN